VVKCHEMHVTTRMIADALGVPTNNVSRILSHWYGRRMPYLSRLPKRLTKNGMDHGCRYRITKYGISAYIKYKNRYEKGFTLNLMYPEKVWRVHDYIVINQNGRRMGLDANELTETIGTLVQPAYTQYRDLDGTLKTETPEPVLDDC
jgi:hypothetical protein